MQTQLPPVRVTRAAHGFITGCFTDGPFKDQRAISTDGVTFLPAGPFVPETTREAFAAVFGSTFASMGAGQ